METIYFAQVDNGNPDTDPIKIGYTSKTSYQRLKQIQTSMPFKLRLLHTIPGNRDTERFLHARFYKTRIYHEGSSTEWFNPTKDLLEYIKTKKEQSPL